MQHSNPGFIVSYPGTIITLFDIQTKMKPLLLAARKLAVEYL